jgi:very-short-patch-repair endonuclease
LTPQPPQGGAKNSQMRKSPLGDLGVKKGGKKCNYLNMDELDKTMYFRASPGIMVKARELRNNMTNSERLLWERLKGKQIYGLRFRRQHTINIFIADFYCHDVKLVVELDGGIHSLQEEYDSGRSAEMEKFGITVIRFTNVEVKENIKMVVTRIENAVSKLMKSPLGGFRG